MVSFPIIAICCLIGVCVCNVCNTEIGEKQVGEVWERDCQHCQCVFTVAGPAYECYPTLCLRDNGCVKWNETGCCPVCEERGCQVGDETYPIGYNENTEPCTTCTCTESGDYICMSANCAVSFPECKMLPGKLLQCCELRHIEGTCCEHEQICPPGFKDK